MNRVFAGWKVRDILLGVAYLGLIGFLVWGPGAPDIPYDMDNPVLPMSFGLVALLLVGLATLLRGVPGLAWRERRLPDGFAWARPPTRRLIGLAFAFYCVYLATQQTNFALTVWAQQDWPRIVILAVLITSLVVATLLEVWRLFDFSVVLSVTSQGMTVGNRVIDWSEVEAAVFDRYGWHQFGLVLVGDDDQGSSQWSFSLTDAGIEAPHFLDRLERAAPQVEVLKPKGEPMAGAHPIPAA
jgi:hypothetical protein